MNRTLLQALIVFMLIVLGKLGAFLRDVLLSSQFGAGTQTDAYFIANAVPGLVFSGVLATISLVVLPIYVQKSLQQDASRESFLHTALSFYLGLAILLSASCIVFAEDLTRVIAPQAPGGTLELATLITRVMATGFVFTTWVGFHNAIQQANKSFIWPNVVPVFNHLVVSIGIIWAASTTGGILGVAIAAVLGWIIQSPVHWYLARKYYTLRFRYLLRPETKYLAQLALLSLPVFISVSLDQLNNVLDIYFGSAFGEGALTHLSFAFRLTILIGGVFALPISFFIFPYLSEALNSMSEPKICSLLSQGIGLVILLTMPIAVYSFVEAEEVIGTIFGRGAFGPSDVAETAAIFRVYVIATVFMGLREVLNRVFIAEQNAKMLIYFSAASLIVHAAASIILMQLFDIVGVALGTTIGTASFVVLQFAYLALKRRKYLSNKILFFGVIAVLSSGICIFVKTMFIDPLHLQGHTGQIFDLVSLAIVYFASTAVLFGLVFKLLRIRLWKL